MAARLTRRGIMAGLALAPVLAPVLASRRASAQARPIRFVVPYSAGSGPDIFARRFAQGMAARLDQPFVVDNRGGASTMIGAEHAASSAPDGQTLFMGTSTTFAANPHLVQRIGYRIEQFQTISMLVRTRLALYAAPSFAATDMAGVIALAKAAREPLHYGITGRGNSTHLTGEALKLAAGIELIDVPYRGTPLMQQGIMRGDLPLAIDGIPAWITTVREGRAKMIAVTGDSRVEALPDIPTFAESGVRDTGHQHWYGLLAPAGIPAPVLARLHAATVATMADAALWQGLVREGATIETNTPERFAALIAEETETWGQVIRRVGMKLE